MSQRTSLKEKTTALRSALKSVGIFARVRMDAAKPWIHVEVKTVDAEFSDLEQRIIRRAAKAIGLTHVRGGEIDIERMTDPRWHLFEMPVQKRVTEMSDAEFADHISQKHAILGRIEDGIKSLRMEFETLDKQLAALRPN